MNTNLFTTSSGVPVTDDQNSLTAGPRGPIAMQDFHLLEKLQHFNRERIPERVVHAKGVGAYGTFKVTHDISKYTKAKLFSAVGNECEILARFSTVGGEKGSADSVRDPRGFAVKFYTEEGNWDMTGNNTPVFFVRDGIKFPDFIRTQKRDPYTHRKSPDREFNFYAESPESLHQVTILYSNRGTPDGVRRMNGYGSHTFSMYTEDGKLTWCKWHYKTKQGIKNLSQSEATRLAGENPDYAQQDLMEAIERKEYPQWSVEVQLASQEELERWEAKTGHDAFDVTKVWPHGDFPLHPVGTMELNRNADNYFAEIEQSAFNPASVPPGLGFSPDKMLQARLFSYHDAHLYRLGTNYQLIPVNRPKCPFHNGQRDGQMMVGNNGGREQDYNPVSMEQAEKKQEEMWGMMLEKKIGRFDDRAHNDFYAQPRALFQQLDKDEQQDLFDNMAGPLADAKKDIQDKMLSQLDKVDPKYGQGVRDAIKKKAEKS